MNCRYARTGSQQSIPGEFDDPGGGRGDTFRNHSRNRESVSKHKIKTPDTGSTVTSKKSVAFAPDGESAFVPSETSWVTFCQSATLKNNGWRPNDALPNFSNIDGMFRVHTVKGLV